MFKYLLSVCTAATLLSAIVPASAAVREYHLVIAREMVTVGDEAAIGMTINGAIPGPTLFFEKGDQARIRVRNEMNVPTSIHWHGLLVPPSMDGVPFISQIPIQPGTTYTYEFPLRQTGTYWYHSHSELQEQSGLYGSIVIADTGHRTDRDHVLLLSDWTTDAPSEVLRTLKRGSDWYALQKGSSQSLFGAIGTGYLDAYLMRELQRMPPMDIADVAYDYFLSNGTPETTLSARPGETVRLRIINGSATTYFHLNFSGGPMTIISADGQLVRPVVSDLFLIGVAETYDVLVTLPDEGSYELRATAHDGSGFTSAWLGEGEKNPARTIPRPNLYEPMPHAAMGSILALTPAGSMGMPDAAVQAGMFDRPGMAHGRGPAAHEAAGEMPGHTMESGSDASIPDRPPGMNHGPALHGSMPMHNGGQTDDTVPQHTMEMDSADRREPLQPQRMPGGNMMPSEMPEPATGHRHEPPPHETGPTTEPTIQSAARGSGSARPFGTAFGLLAADIAARPHLATEGGPERPQTPYALLTSANPRPIPADTPIREIRLTLDGDMERYTWFINDKPLSESDHILIREDEVVRFIMINRTMMHHPMHLHGHFFRVLNGQGAGAPFKHTVDVAPMATTVIEFYADEGGDWFFHCHLLYHMKSGMARVVHYQGFEPEPAVTAVRSELYEEASYLFGFADILTSMTEGEATLARGRWDIAAAWEVGWQGVDTTEWEGLGTAAYHLNRFTALFGGVDLLGEGSSSEDIRGVMGVRYLLPLNFESTVWIDTDGGGRLSLEKELTLTPRLTIQGEVEYDTHDQWEGQINLAYLISKEFSALAGWHSEYGIGIGLQLRL